MISNTLTAKALLKAIINKSSIMAGFALLCASCLFTIQAKISVFDQDGEGLSIKPIRWFTFDIPQEDDEHDIPIQRFNKDTQTLNYYLEHHKKDVRPSFSLACAEHGLRYGGWLGGLFVVGYTNGQIPPEDKPDLRRGHGINPALADLIWTTGIDGKEWPAEIVDAMIESRYVFRNPRQNKHKTPYVFATTFLPLTTLEEIDRAEIFTPIKMNVHMPSLVPGQWMDSTLRKHKQRSGNIHWTQALLDIKNGVTIDQYGLHQYTPTYMKPFRVRSSRQSYLYQVSRAKPANIASHTQLLIGCY